MAINSVDIAIKEAIRALEELGSDALYTPEEITNVIKHSFIALNVGEGDKESYQQIILAIIGNASERIETKSGETN